MTKAEYYRKQHRERQEEPWKETLKVCGAFVASALIWLALFLVVVPRL